MPAAGADMGGVFSRQVPSAGGLCRVMRCRYMVPDQGRGLVNSYTGEAGRCDARTRARGRVGAG